MFEPPPRSELEERVLILVRGEHEGTITLSLLAKAGFAGKTCRDVTELCGLLAEGAGAALLAEEVLTAPALGAVHRELTAQPAWSDFPLVVFSAANPSDKQRSAAIAVLGNVTFLDRPVHVRTMIASVQSALRSRQRQYEARRAIQSRDSFLAMLGHELRNPLGVITFALAVLEKSSSAPPPREYGVIARQARHLSRLVDELLDVARVTHGKVTLKREPLDLVEIARHTFDALLPSARARQLAYELQVPAHPLLVQGDRQRLEQVLNNLLTNAIKYTPPSGSVWLDARMVGSSVHVAVSDTGVGLAAEMRDRVFAPFAQVDASLDRAEGGLGLGLALVRSIVLLHGGEVHAFSEGLGRGSRFEMRLPYSGTVSQSSTDVAHDVAGSIERRRIVLVEDNADIRELFAELLERSGHEVCVADDGPKGLEQVLAFAPDVAFVDVGLPGFDGFELARRVRANGSRVRLVALTGYGQAEDKRRAAEAGFDEHLVKPVLDDDIVKAIARASA
jgi:signal transduction histidine kinase/CheY-like chemotaxis protein